MSVHSKYDPITRKLLYWKNYSGSGDKYRKAHDLDCVLTGGNPNADTIISLWLPLRYALNHFDMPRWKQWKEFEDVELRSSKHVLKDCADFLNDMIEHIDNFLPDDSELTTKLSILFSLGQQRCNVMLLPQGKREWNTLRGRRYFDYLPHFLFDLFTYSIDEDVLLHWLDEQDMQPFFANETFAQENILDLAGTGSPCRHNPRGIDLDRLLDNYIAILRRRAELLALRTS